jgi:hypothetical protein
MKKIFFLKMIFFLYKTGDYIAEEKSKEDEADFKTL